MATCGDCEYFGADPKHSGCAVGGGAGGHGMKCTFRPSRWVDRHAGKGIYLGSKRDPSQDSLVGSFHVLHHGEKVTGEKTIRTKDGVKTFKTGGKKSGRVSKASEKG